MSERNGLTLGAKSIKAELSLKFPNTKFSVRSRTYVGGNSISALWSGGPTREQIESIVSKYEEGEFNGMTDSYERDEDPQRNEFRRIRGSAKYVTLHRRAV